MDGDSVHGKEYCKCSNTFHGNTSSVQDGASTKCGFKPLGSRRFGNTIDGSQAEYLLVPDAMANLAPIPNGLSDEQVLMCPNIMSTEFSGAESGDAT